jgi:hypothetical protein
MHDQHRLPLAPEGEQPLLHYRPALEASAALTALLSRRYAGKIVLET